MCRLPERIKTVLHRRNIAEILHYRASVDDAEVLEDARVLSRMGEKEGAIFGKRGRVAKNRRDPPCVRVRWMLLNIVLAGRNVKAPRSGRARGSFRKFRGERKRELSLFSAETRSSRLGKPPDR